MTRFILVSFCLLAWSYYELSGGADFVAGPVSASAKAPEVSTSVLPARAQPLPEPVRTQPQPQLVAFAQPADTNIRSDARIDRIEDVLLTTRRDDVAVAAPAPVEAAAAPVAEPQADLRQIAGSRVNMRQGPGTQHSVVTKLGRGDSVEVLRREGDWLKLRVTDSRQIGWIAAYLVTDAAQ